MATTYKAIYKRFNGTDWDTFYFATRADQVAEITTGTDSTTRKFVTVNQSANIVTYLMSGFNGNSQLLQLDGTGKIPSANLPFSISDYVVKNNGTFSGTLNAGTTGANIDMKQGELQFGYGTVSASNLKWKLEGYGQQMRLYHDVGAGFVPSVYISSANIAVANKQIKEVATPTAGTDATNKEYVDNLIASGMKWKDPVKAASIGNIDTAVALNTLDGVTLASDNRVLLKNQTTASQNGVYLLNASKIPQKVADDSTIGTTVFVEGGTVNNDFTYHCNAANTWVVVSKTDTYTADESSITKSGTQFGVKALGITNAMLAGSINITKLANYAMTQELLWTQIPNADGTTTNSLFDWMRGITSSIKNLRGTSLYNTNNSETIAGAYDLAEVKNRTYRGDTAPGAGSYVTGDLYFEGVAI